MGIACVICYSFAFPLFVYFKFAKNKSVIFEDQLLAAQDRGEKPISNPNFGFRKRYAKLYKNYKPDKWFWVLAILGRKLAICFTALMFKRNPSFQLSVALLVLFTSFTAQVLNRPFMSMDERAAVVKLASSRDYKRGHKMLRKMSAFGESHEIEHAKKRLAMEEQAQLQIARALQVSAAYFVNYNTVETFFLGCSIYVCLAGIMFSSGYFVNPYYWPQRDGLAYLTLLIVLLSCGYFCYVIAMEVTGVKKYRRAKNKAKWSAFKKKAHFHKDLFKLDNSNATVEEKKAAETIEAAIKGKLARKKLHDDIEQNGSEEQKSKLHDLEDKREKRRLEKKKKKKRRRKSKSMKRRKSKRRSKSLKKQRSKTAESESKADEVSPATKADGEKLATWGK